MRLHHQPRSRSTRVLWLLEELGEPFDLTVMPREAKQTPEYRALHPLGRSPALETDDGPVFESAALILHIADLHLEAGLIGPLGSYERALHYQWCFFGMTEIESALMDIARQLWKDGDPIEEVVDRATARFVKAADVVEQALGDRRLPRRRHASRSPTSSSARCSRSPARAADGAAGGRARLRRPARGAPGPATRGRGRPARVGGDARSAHGDQARGPPPPGSSTGSRAAASSAASPNMPVLLLTTTGRRTGRRTTTPLTYFETGDGDLVVVGSNGGEDAPPSWWLNLLATPEATITLGTRAEPVTARAATAAEHERLWPVITGDQSRAMRATQGGRAGRSRLVVLSRAESLADQRKCTGSVAPSSSSPANRRLRVSRSGGLQPPVPRARCTGEDREYRGRGARVRSRGNVRK